MLKLKYLFNNVDLAEMVVGNWEYDEPSLEMFSYYRISSNAIYPFRSKGKIQLLRFSSTMEKNREAILAELDFIAYLRSKDYGVLEVVESKNGEKLVEVQTPWGDYYASVFKRVPGVQIGDTEVSDSIVFNYGKALGKLHQISSGYDPVGPKRWSHSDVFDWMQSILIELPNETLALKEIKILQNYFNSVPKTSNNYGLIHFDFEYDNVFYDEQTASCYAIDFDDSMYHWYVMDIVQAIDSLEDCVPPEMLQEKKQCFWDGYQTEFEISEDMMALLPACKRFANLYSYVRLLRSTEEKWNNEPRWLVDLRQKLKEAMKTDSLCFGKDL
ncbi:phosphotransferase enzyme family protein [Sporosarcina sp. Te-1]|uniref:phosphotransferase enzyme family protein n=1 Tax=Sporosarcina sp. Te-1 TaxID=2818390 RepID=UPI001A9D1C66|nr:phosphotransferase [Sporosarcina sp. Te-1]QTD41836.1 phosphotransferase [Sporosarcina sp. Te-1]